MDWTNEEFLRYVEEHSKTERALFHRDDALRLVALAGTKYVNGPPVGWITIRYDVAKGLIEKARARLSGSDCER